MQIYIPFIQMDTNAKVVKKILQYRETEGRTAKHSVILIFILVISCPGKHYN